MHTIDPSSPPAVSWPATVAVAALTGVVAGVAGGFLADRYADWQAWDQREGSAGYAVIFWALASGVLGAVLGAVIARRLGPALGGSFAPTLGASVATVLATCGVLYVYGHWSADLAPELGGEALHLQVELRWPASQTERPAAPDGGTGRVRYDRYRFGSRVAESTGLLWVEDAARGADGRWTATGVTPITSSYGSRAALTVVLDPARRDRTAHTVRLPLAGSPAEADRAWSRWLDLDGGFGVRYRVVPRSSAVRTERVGPFAVDLVDARFSHRRSADDRWEPDGPGVITEDGGLVVRRDGRVVRPAPNATGGPARVDDRGAVDGVAVVPGPRPALLLFERRWNGATDATLAVAERDGVRVTRVPSQKEDTAVVHPATNDPARFRSAPRTYRRGRADRTLLAAPGLYVVGNALLDTRSLTLRALAPDTTVDPDVWQPPAERWPPIAFSPDGRSVVRYTEVYPARADDVEAGTADSSAVDPEPRPALRVADAEAGRTYTLPIDRHRMRYGQPSELDPAWVAHHFAWVRGADGADRLARRPSFVPLPRRGYLWGTTPESPEYVVPGARPALVGEVAAVLAGALGAEPLPAEEGSAARLRAGEWLLYVSQSSRDRGGLVVFASSAQGRPRHTRGVMERVAAAVDAALATGRYDHLFAPRPRGGAAPRGATRRG